MNLHTLHVEHVYLLVVYAVLTIANARLQRGMRGVMFFVLYSFLALAGAMGVIFRGVIPDFISIDLGNICVLGGYLALYLSMNRLFKFERKQTVLAMAWFVFGSAAMIWWGSVHPSTGPRLFAFSFFLALQQLQLASLLFFGGAERLQLSWMLGGMLTALAAANGVRMGTVLITGAPVDYLQSGPALAGIVLANACLQCGVMVAYVWMTAAILRQRLELQATTDPLTGLLNRRALDGAAERAIKSCRAGTTVFSAIMVDLDAYKPINDRLGHAAGDTTLIAVARGLEGEMRRGDVLARSGGDEFVALLPDTTLDEAMGIAERLRHRLERLDLGLKEKDVRVTGSFGVAEASPGATWDVVYALCDRALYTVKERGGNAVSCHEAEARAEESALIWALP